eukprot:3502131-Rhodomonas_salina.2
MFERDLVPGMKDLGGGMQDFECIHATMSEPLSVMAETARSVQGGAGNLGVAVDDIGLCTCVRSSKFQ